MLSTKEQRRKGPCESSAGARDLCHVSARATGAELAAPISDCLAFASAPAPEFESKPAIGVDVGAEADAEAEAEVSCEASSAQASGGVRPPRRLQLSPRLTAVCTTCARPLNLQANQKVLVHSEF